MRAFRSFRRRKLVRDTLILQLSRTLGAALGTLSVIVVVRGLGLEEFGRWGLLLALNETWSLLNLSGVALSTQTRLAIALGEGAEREEIADLLAQYLLFALAWAALSFVVLSALAPTVTRWFYTDAASIGYVEWLALAAHPWQLDLSVGANLLPQPPPHARGGHLARAEPGAPAGSRRACTKRGRLRCPVWSTRAWRMPGS